MKLHIETKKKWIASCENCRNNYEKTSRFNKLCPKCSDKANKLKVKMRAK